MSTKSGISPLRQRAAPEGRRLLRIDRLFFMFIAIILSLLLGESALYTQEEESLDALQLPVEQDNTTYRIYDKRIIEDFETNEFGQTQLRMIGADRNGRLRNDDVDPAPENQSRRHLALRLREPVLTEVLINLPKPILIQEYVLSFSLWVYGQGRNDFVYLHIRNNYGYTYKLKLGVMNFYGWRKLTYTLGAGLKQMDMTLNKKTHLEVVKIGISPARAKRATTGWRTLYLDDLTATVRRKYIASEKPPWDSPGQ